MKILISVIIFAISIYVIIFIIWWCIILVLGKKRGIGRTLRVLLLILGLVMFYQIALKEYKVVDLEKRGIELSEEERKNIMMELPQTLISKFGYNEMKITKIAYEVFYGPGGETTYYLFFKAGDKEYMCENVTREHKKIRDYVDQYFRWWENIGKKAERNGIEIEVYDVSKRLS